MRGGVIRFERSGRRSLRCGRPPWSYERAARSYGRFPKRSERFSPCRNRTRILFSAVVPKKRYVFLQENMTTASAAVDGAVLPSAEKAPVSGETRDAGVFGMETEIAPEKGSAYMIRVVWKRYGRKSPCPLN
ncbi:hypothetical protein C6I21_03550 [Alkalicoccus urumqiensis]|uniref:Uncharacterized protein n=1 Tax=Alkalicoccus urumqiensis TaxID=1548213 RepID=A0A2P6MJH6_ALKUR|nr:hypothetical protein C6I21_03550 [Alkalicoccus urumqiensis]